MIGGAEIYAEALPLADELFLTEIDDDVAGDTFFPEWDRERLRAGLPGRARLGRRRALRVRHLPPPLGAAPARCARRGRRTLRARGLAYWLFGGWAVDFHAGSTTRPHSDVDIAIWLEDLPRIAALLEEDGWHHAPEPDEDGGTGYERAGVRLELTFLVRGESGRVVTPLRTFEAVWPEDAFGDAMR